MALSSNLKESISEVLSKTLNPKSINNIINEIESLYYKKKGINPSSDDNKKPSNVITESSKALEDPTDPNHAYAAMSRICTPGGYGNSGLAGVVNEEVKTMDSSMASRLSKLM